MNLKEEMRVYDAKDSIMFRKTSEKYGGLSNMASGYPIVVNNNFIRSSEALYQAIRFTHLPQVQQEIISQTSPMTAKMISKKYRKYTREDWDDIRLSVMRWVLRVKLVQNKETFGTLLLSTKNLPIVEESLKDGFWGAKPCENKLEGVNALGRLLMELREIYKNQDFDVVNPLKISNFKFLGQDIEDVSAFDKLDININNGLFKYE